MSKYFRMSEMLYSSTAERLHIVNTPNKEEMEHLEELMVFLDRIREAWGSGIVVSSGFRCKELNKAVGGVSNSAHLQGYAADIVPANGKMKEFKEFIVKWAKGKEYDEILLEKNSKGSEWVHVAIKNVMVQQRKKCFKLNVK